mgnify:CR=1 FL=1
MPFIFFNGSFSFSHFGFPFSNFPCFKGVSRFFALLLSSFNLSKSLMKPYEKRKIRGKIGYEKRAGRWLVLLRFRKPSSAPPPNFTSRQNQDRLCWADWFRAEKSVGLDRVGTKIIWTPWRIDWTGCFFLIYNGFIIHILQKILSYLCPSKFLEPK